MTGEKVVWALGGETLVRGEPWGRGTLVESVTLTAIPLGHRVVLEPWSVGPRVGTEPGSSHPCNRLPGAENACGDPYAWTC